MISCKRNFMVASDVANRRGSITAWRDRALSSSGETRLEKKILERTLRNQKKELDDKLDETKRSRPTFFSYSLVFVIALFKDIMDFVGIGSLPAIGTVITFCLSLLIFLLLLITRTNKKLIDSRFIIRTGLILLACVLVEGFAFGLNFLPIETATIFIIYFMDKHLSDKQIEKVVEALKVFNKLYRRHRHRLA